MEWVTSGPWESLRATALLFAVVWIASRAGGVLLKIMKAEPDGVNPGESFLFSLMAGVVFLSLQVLGLGMAGLLNRAAVLAALLLTGLLGYFWRPSGRKKTTLEIKRTFLEKAVLFWIFTVLILSWIRASAPPIGNDALSYHLYHPKIFIEHQKMAVIPLSRESLWPYLTETLFTLGLMIQGTSMAQFFHWLFYPLTGFAVYLFVNRFYGQREALLAALSYFLCPMAFAQSGHSYVDLSLAFFTFMVFYGWSLRSESGEGTAAALSGLAAGAAAATKYLGLAPALTGFLLWGSLSKNRMKALPTFLFFSALAAAVWYLRSWFLLGNPVYPFFPSIFGKGMAVDFSEGAGFGKGPLHFLTFAWDLTMHPNVFGGEFLGAQYLVFLPYLAFLWKGSKKISRELFFFTFLCAFLLFKQSQYARFYLALVPFLSVGAGVAAARMFQAKGRLLKSAAFLTLIIFMGLHGGIDFYRMRNVWSVAAGFESGEDYLAHQERSFKGFRFLKDHAATGDKILNSGDIRHFYSAVPGTVMDSAFLREELRSKGSDISQHLLKEGYDYIFLQDDPLVRNYAESNGYLKVFAYDFKEGPKTWNFTVYESPNHRSRALNR